MSGKLQEASDRFAEALARAREWFRRLMPRVALAAGALFLVRLLVRDTWLYRSTSFGLLGPLTIFAVAATILYYGLKSLVRLKRLMLWKVRRRLIITYLFVGLTPVVLLLMLGALAATGGSSQAMVRVVTVQLDATERQTLESARALASALVQLPPNMNERAAQDWLDERAALLRGALPGARVSVWRGQGEAQAALLLGKDEQAQLASAAVDDGTRGVGFDTGDAREPLPAWLAGSAEWSGFAYLPPPEDSQSAFCTPSVRALVREWSGGRAVAVLLTVPVSRALINRYRENTGINLRPFFLIIRDEEEGSQGARVRFDLGDPEVDRDADAGGSVPAPGKRRLVMDFTRDQFGDRLPRVSGLKFPYPVFLNATEWQTGTQSPQCAFVVDWSWAEGGKQFWSDAVLGRRWWRALYTIAVAFLVFELMALLSAAWMTRAVTGTVHKLYRATGFIKRGDFSHRIRTRSRDQLGELALAFNDMSSNVETLLAERVEHELLKREVEIAHEVQEQLFPRSTPALRTARMAGECRAARGVAGDYYDFIEAAPGLVVLTLGDVSGKGLSASLVMSNLQAALRAQVAIIAERMRGAGRGAARAGNRPTTVAAAADAGAIAADAGVIAAETVAVAAEAVHAVEVSRGVTGFDARRAVSDMAESINEQLCRATDANRFATLFLALYDDGARTLRYTNAGHNAPVLVRADGSVERLWKGGTVLGAFDSVKFEEGETTLGEDDLLVVFSDGLTEAQNATGEEYGEQRLVAFAAARRQETVENIRRDIFDEVDRWSGDAERGDDQTLVILKAESKE
ncbi:MAG: phosphoserine phosphatase RsbU/P [Acidobacteriota bacterium]|jgi:sigma-B regulation protein RsbU (phosphoserine phosphatase)|nr:phosphoserine phosphatase RsbU/P [Acidobacteriota bacterium]